MVLVQNSLDKLLSMSSLATHFSKFGNDVAIFSR